MFQQTWIEINHNYPLKCQMFDCSSPSMIALIDISIPRYLHILFFSNAISSCSIAQRLLQTSP